MVMSGKSAVEDYGPSTCTGRAEPHSDIVYSRLLDMYRRDIPRYEVLTKVARSSFSLYYERYKYVFDTT